MLFYYNKNKIILDKGWKPIRNGYTKVQGREHISFKTDPFRIMFKKTDAVPFFYNDDEVSTYPVPGLNLLPYDHDLVFEQDKISAKYIPHKTIQLESSSITFDQYVELIINQISKCFDNKQNYVIGKSNGLDSTAIQAVMDYNNIKYQTLYHDKIITVSQSPIVNMLQKENWGFRQVPYFDKPTNFVTGFYGDEYILRSPKYVQWHLNKHGVDLIQEFARRPNCYMFEFYKRSYENVLTDLKPNPQYLQNILNDHQMWSFDETTIISPYHDLDILQKGLGLDVDNVIKQVTEGIIQKEIITRTNKKLLDELDKSKNASDPVGLFLET